MNGGALSEVFLILFFLVSYKCEKSNRTSTFEIRLAGGSK